MIESYYANCALVLAMVLCSGCPDTQTKAKAKAKAEAETKAEAGTKTEAKEKNRG